MSKIIANEAVQNNERRLGWRGYAALGLGVVALGATWALTDPEGARAFGEGVIDAITPEFHPLFEGPTTEDILGVN